MRALRAVLINYTVAALMHSFDVFPPQVSLVRTLEVAPKTRLSEVFENNLLSFDRLITRLQSAVLSASEAVILDVIRVAVMAFPEDEVWCELGLSMQFVFHRLKILEEV